MHTHPHPKEVSPIMAFVLNLLARRSALKTLAGARSLLENLTPLKSNCGRLCGGACCQSDESGENGMLLFPFEDELYKQPIEGFAFHLADDDTLFKGGRRLVCEGVCPREHRPLACRLFPLRIRLDTQGEETHAVAEPDPRAWYICPLLEQGGLRAMSQEFIKAVEAAGDVLAGNVYMLEALLNEQRLLDETRVL